MAYHLVLAIASTKKSPLRAIISITQSPIINRITYHKHFGYGYCGSSLVRGDPRPAAGRANSSGPSMPAPPDSDDDLAVVVRECRAAGERDRPAQRGFLHTKIARRGKALASIARRPMLAPHVRQLIRVYNEDNARTREDVLDVFQTKLVRVRGSGKYKCWLPTACQRACWGQPARPRIARKPRKRLVRKTSARTTVDPYIASTRTWAYFLRGCPTHVGRVRQAMSELYIRIQLDRILVLPRAQRQYLEIALDETEMPMSGRVKNEITSVMVVHATVKRPRNPAGGDVVFDECKVVAPPITPRSTSADDLYACLLARLPTSLANIKALADETTVFFNTDSAKSCGKLGRYLETITPTLRCPCRMHQFCLVLVGGMVLAGVIGAIFCGALLLHRKRIQTLMRKRLRGFLEAHVRMQYDPPSPEDKAHKDAVLNFLLKYAFDCDALDSGCQPVSGRHPGHRRQPAPRERAVRRLSRNLSGTSLHGMKLCHYCPMGCHASPVAVIDEMEEDINVIFSSPPIIIAMNKWTKIMPPTAWFAALLSIGVLLAFLVGALEELYNQMDLTPSEDELLGYKSDRSFLREEAVRLRRFRGFVGSSIMRVKLVALSMSFQVSMAVCGAFFNTSANEPSRLARAPVTLDMIRPSRSPAVRAIRDACHALANERHRHWKLLVADDSEWTVESWTAASVPSWVQVGELYERLVEPVDQWPWRAGLLVDPELSMEAKRAVGQEILDVCSHTVPFMAAYRRNLRTLEDVLSEDNAQRTIELLTAAPLTNIVSEQSFARARGQQAAKHGLAPEMPALAAGLTLAKAGSQLHAAVSAQTFSAEVRPPPVPVSAWAHYVQLRRSGPPARTLAELGVSWGKLSAAERESYHPPRKAPRLEPEAKAISIWPHCGDAVYPIKETLLRDFPGAINNLASAWSRRVSGEPPRLSNELEAPCQENCEARWGRGRCREAMLVKDIAALDCQLRRMDRWTVVLRRPPARFDEMWRLLPLLWFGRDVAAGSAGSHDDGYGVWLMQLCGRLRRQVYHVQRGRKPMVGDVVRLLPCLENVRSKTKVMQDCVNIPGGVAYHVSHELVGLRDHRVLAVEPMRDLEAAHARAHARDLEARRMRRLANFAAGGARARPARPRGARAPGFRLPRDEGVDGEEDPLDVLDDAVEAEADDEDEEKSDDGGGGSDGVGGPWVGLEALVPEAEMAEVRAMLARADGPPETVRYDEETGDVFQLSDGGRIGKMWLTNVGRPAESLVIYCDRHKCRHMRRCGPGLPHHEALLDWYRAGLALRAGPEGKKDHMDLFPTVVAE